MKWVVLGGGGSQEVVGPCMAWLGIADGIKAEAFTFAAAEARLMSRPPKLALQCVHACHADML